MQYLISLRLLAHQLTNTYYLYLLFLLPLSTGMTSNVSNKSNPRSELETALVDDANNNFTQRYTTVRQYLDSMAKPVGSLGSIEDYGARIAALQRSSRPVINKPICLIFAA